jgi:periplasmic protein CpxP/Spy
MKTAFVRIAFAMMFASVTPFVTVQTQGPPRGENLRRDLLEQRLRERTGEVVRRRLELNDAQMKQLQNANRQFEQKRGALVVREREVRRELREEILSGDKADQQKVAQLLDQTMQLQRQRLDLMQNEQRELARFLTPVQRAKLIGLQNEMRRRAQELRARPMGRKGPPGGRREFDQ